MNLKLLAAMFMQIGCIRVEFYLHGVFSLKEKRNIANSIKQKLKNKFNISIAEIESQDNINRLVFGIVTVSNNGKVIQKVADNLFNFLEKITSEEIVDTSLEIFSL
ncbi:DUF503 domain-containing protein [Desulfothermus okinawensis JCM 13304]